MATHEDPPASNIGLGTVLRTGESHPQTAPVDVWRDEKPMREQTPTEWVESLYPATMGKYDSILKANRELFCSKQSDYGPNNVSMGQDLNTDHGRAVALAALAVRINDKAQRLVNLTMVKPLRGDQHGTNHEPVIDSFRDLINYAIMAQIVYSGDWGK